MPWNGPIFERMNPDFTGPEVWQDDQKVPVKIIAYRHDIHDQDLANGIADCLNLDGLNAMRADLDMAGFDLVNWSGGGAGDPTNLSILSHNINTFDIKSSTGNQVTLPAVTDTLSGLMTTDMVARIVALEGGGGGGGDPDQTLSLFENDPTKATLAISLAGGGSQGVEFTGASGTIAGLLTGDQFKKMDGLWVDGGGDTKAMIFDQTDPLYPSSVRIFDHIGAEHGIGIWAGSIGTQAGVFVGNITNVAPIDTVGSVNHEVWFVY